MVSENSLQLSADQQRVLQQVRAMPQTRSTQLVQIGNLAQLQQEDVITLFSVNIGRQR